MTEQLAGQAAEGAVPYVMELYAQKARLQLMGDRELLSSGMTGVIRVVFTFSEDWDGLKKTAVFSNGAISIDVPEADWVENGCTVPQQVLTAAGKNLMVGLFGTDGEEVALPTVWCSLGRVEPGAALSGTDAIPPEAPIWARLEKRLGQMEGMTLRLVRVIAMMPGGDGSTTVSLDHTFDQIEAACGEGHPVALELSGTLLPLTRLIPGTSAEFAGTAFLQQGMSYCYHCLVQKKGAGVLAALRVDGEAFEVRFNHADSGYTADHTNAQIYAAVEAGKFVAGFDPTGRRLQLYRCSPSLAWFTAIGYDHDDEIFVTQAYRLENDRVIADFSAIPDEAQLVQRVIEALPVYGGEVAG